MPTRQVTHIVTSLVVVLALVGEPRFDFADRTFASDGLLAAEASPQRKSVGRDAKESLEFRAAMAAHHICSGLWVVGRSHKRTPEEVVAQDIAPFQFFGWEPEFEYKVDHQRRMVTVTAPGAPPRTAKYNGDQGSTILPSGEKDVYYKPVPVPRGLPDAATQPWPNGDVRATEPIPDGVDAEAVAAALDWAMEQKKQNTRAFVVAYGGKIIGERYAPGWTKDSECRVRATGRRTCKMSEVAPHEEVSNESRLWFPTVSIARPAVGRGRSPAGCRRRGVHAVVQWKIACRLEDGRWRGDLPGCQR